MNTNKRQEIENQNTLCCSRSGCRLLLLITLLVITTLAICHQAQAASKPKLSKTRLTLTVGKKQTLKVNNAGKKKVKWRSANKRIATVSSKGVVKAKAAGKTVITAKVGGRTLRCKVTVKKSTRKNDTHTEAKTVEKRMNNTSSDAAAMSDSAAVQDIDAEQASVVSADYSGYTGYGYLDYNTNTAHPAKYSYEVYVLGLQPHVVYSGVYYLIYVKTDNPNGKSFSIRSDGTLAKEVYGQCADVNYSDTKTMKVSGGYLVMYSFETPGSNMVSIVEYQDQTGSPVNALTCYNQYGYRITLKRFTLNVIDTEAEYDKWIDGLLQAHTKPSMSSLEKMESICNYLNSAQADFSYPKNINDKVVKLAGDAFGPAFVTHMWDSYETPQILCKIAAKIGGFSDIHNCYYDYPTSSEEWKTMHSYCRVTAGSTVRYFSVCPPMSTGTITGYKTFDFTDQSKMWHVG